MLRAILVLIGLSLLTGCEARNMERELPTSHPANPGAPVAPYQTPENSFTDEAAHHGESGMEHGEPEDHPHDHPEHPK